MKNDELKIRIFNVPQGGGENCLWSLSWAETTVKNITRIVDSYGIQFSGNQKRLSHGRGRKLKRWKKNSVMLNSFQHLFFYGDRNKFGMTCGGFRNKFGIHRMFLDVHILFADSEIKRAQQRTRKEKQPLPYDRSCLKRHNAQ